MSYIIADNIISPLGIGTSTNVKEIMQGNSSIMHYDKFKNYKGFDFWASMFDENFFTSIPLFTDLKNIGYSFFEQLIILSINNAIKDYNIHLDYDKTILIIASTKGNIEYLDSGKKVNLFLSAQKVQNFFHLTPPPIVVSNACISGVNALIIADRLLKQQYYKTAIVVGCDVLSYFILSGFNALKALASSRCRPFDKNRDGLNLGEGAGCVILSETPIETNKFEGYIENGSLHNDANHISGPSRTGEGTLRCLLDVCKDSTNNPTFINSHGTGTLYNDEMEAIAIHRAGLQNIPVNSLKGVLGHTLGAAGIIETILSLYALNHNIILPTIGFEQTGTSYMINVSNLPRKTNTDNKTFIKILSGFGGCNAAIKICKLKQNTIAEKKIIKADIIDNVKMDSSHAWINNQLLPTCNLGDKLLTELYNTYIKDYPKFFKMDILCRLGFVATELLLNNRNEKRFIPRNDRAVIFANKSSCIVNDIQYNKTILNGYPSPSLFVYTLPNIVTGEIAIRNKYYAETAFYLLENKNHLMNIAKLSFTDTHINSIIAGWVECDSPNSFEADIWLLNRSF